MRKLVFFLVCALFVGGLTWNAMSMTFNGAAPGATASMTPVAVGTSTPVVVLACGSVLNAPASNTSTTNIDFAVTGGTSGTDGCYVMPAPTASPCASPSPAPNASTQVGLFVGTGGSAWGHYPINYPANGGAQFLSSEWTAVCSAASMKVSVTTFP